jgi:hypothetical protein
VHDAGRDVTQVEAGAAGTAQQQFERVLHADVVPDHQDPQRAADGTGAGAPGTADHHLVHVPHPADPTC